MPKFTTTLLLCLLASLYAQAQQKTLFTLGAAPAALQRLHPKATTIRSLQVQPNIAKGLLANRPDKVEIVFPDPADAGKEIVFSAEKSRTINPGAVVMGTGKKLHRAPEMAFYNAPMRNGNGMAISITKLTDGNLTISGLLTTKAGSYTIAPIEGAVILYKDTELPKNPFHCGSDELARNAKQLQKRIGLQPKNQVQGANDTCKSVKMSVEADYQAFQDNGRSVDKTVSWIYSMFHVVGILYKNVGVNMEVVEVYVNTAPDNYPTDSSFKDLDAFGDTLGVRGFTGNLAHLLSTKPTSLGGIAYISALCESYNIGFSNCDYAYKQLPTYSWTIGVVAHEIGHNMSSPHTHNCSWELTPGIFGAIDSCYTSEGGCFDTPVYRVGTIMSYCHLNASIDLALGFGPLPSAKIKSYYEAATCLNSGAYYRNLVSVGFDTACQGENVTLPATVLPGLTYRWTGPNNYSSTLANPVLPNIQASQAGRYELVVSRGSCSTLPLPSFVYLNCLPTTVAGGALLCRGESITVTAVSTSAPSANNKYVFEVSDASGSFANITKVDSVTSSATRVSRTIALPTSLVPGSNYKVRVRTTAPNKVGAEASTGFAIASWLSSPTTTGASRSNPGSVTLRASAARGQILWYTAPTGGSLVGRGVTYNTPNLTATTTYYAQAAPGPNQNAGQQGKGSYTGAQLSNYQRGIYFTALAAMRLDSVTIYAGSPGALTINITRITDQMQVFTSTQNVVASQTAGQKIAVGANLAAGVYLINCNGSAVMSLYRILDNNLSFPYVTPGLVSVDSVTIADNPFGGWYYLFNWRVSAQGCPSDRVPATALIGTSCTPPSAPPAQNSYQACQGSTVNLMANGSIPSGYTLSWFNTPTSTSPAFSAQSVGVTVTRTDTLFLAYVSTTNASCASGRTPLIVVANPAPPAPSIPAISRCGAGAVTLTGSLAGLRTIRWFSSTGTLLDSGASHTTPSLAVGNASISYRGVSAIGCSSALSTVLISINPIPQTPTVPDLSRCGVGTFSLSANLNGNRTIRWATAGRIDSGAMVTTQTLPVGLTTYQATAVSTTGCVSPATNFSLTVNALPSAPPVADQSRCGAGTFTLSAPLGSNRTIRWTSTGRRDSGASISTPSLAVGVTQYQAVAVSPQGCVSAPDQITLTVNAVPLVPTLTLLPIGLHSNVAGHNSWYLNGRPLADTSQTLPRATLAPGTYRAVAGRNGCLSDTSAPFVVSGMQNKISHTGISVQPNPTRGQFTIYADVPQGAANTYALINALGQTIRTGLLLSQSTEVDGSQIAPGVYFVRVSSSGQPIATQRLQIGR